MTDFDTNPYAPPVEEAGVTSPWANSDSRAWRIEKNAMILPPPFILPEACFLTGSLVGLRQCEVPLKVMPRWSNYVIPLIIFGSQFLAFSAGIAAQKFKPGLQLWFGSPLVGTIISGFVSVIFVAAFAGIFLVKKKITLIGYWANAESVFRRRRLTLLLFLIIDVVLVAGLIMTWLLFEGSLPLVRITLTVVPLAFVVTWIVWLRNRKPWSRIGALLQADGSLAVYGLDPSFLAVCRLGLDEPTCLKT